MDAHVLQPLVDALVGTLPRLAAGLVVLVLGMWVAGLASRGVSRALRARGTDPELTLLLARVTRITLGTAALVSALSQVEFDLTGFVAGLGIVGFTVGFALQDVSKNLVAGLLLLLQQPFDIGDAVEVAGYAGVVTGIDLRATRVRTFDGLEVLIPNTDVYMKVVKLFGEALHRRLECAIVVQATDLERASAVVKAALLAVPGVVHDKPEPRAMISRITQSACTLQLWFWSEHGSSPIEVSDRAALAIVDALAAASLQVDSITMGPASPDAVGGAGAMVVA